MINILFSGVDKEKGFTSKQTEILKKDVKKDAKIVFISTIFDNYQRSDEQLNRYLLAFNKIGIEFKEYLIIDNRINKKDAIDSINNSDVVFLLGGSPDLQMISINEYELVEPISKAKIVIGVSAGSMNQSDIVMYRDDFENYIMKKYKGLGLVNVNIFPHISLDDIKLLNEAKEISDQIPLILLPNESFIRIDNKKMSVFGNYWIMDKGKILPSE